MPSKIEWTDETWNPVTGCTKVSPGCAHSYAERLTMRFGGQPYLPGKAEITLHSERLMRPLSWRKPRRVFVNSMSDLFHEAVPDKFIDQVFGIMALAPQHTFQVLTKRPERMCEYFAPGRYRDVAVGDAANRIRPNSVDTRWMLWPLPNVWLGVSVENQRFADQRIPLLLETPAAVRFVSAEPLLGVLDLRAVRAVRVGTSYDMLLNSLTGQAVAAWRGRETKMYPSDKPRVPSIEWVIAGGESGPYARQPKLEWVRSLRDQCVDAEVPFFFKQWGGLHPKSGGRLLDDREWDQFPNVQGAAI